MIATLLTDLPTFTLPRCCFMHLTEASCKAQMVGGRREAGMGTLLQYQPSKNRVHSLGKIMKWWIHIYELKCYR